MPRLSNANPSYRRHRASGQAVVSLAGTDHYLGRFGTKASRNEYDRLIAEFLTNGRRPIGGTSDLTVAELVAAYWKHALGYYLRTDGQPANELVKIKSAMAPLVRLYSKIQAADFGPLGLEAVRGEMVALGWCRNTVNAQVGRVKKMFKWAVAKEMVPASLHHALTAVSGLRSGRTTARDSEPVRPVPDATVEQTLPHLSPTIQAMVKLQLLTGARPGEVCSMRTVDIDRGDKVWSYAPADHKSRHLGKRRVIHIGPIGQDVLLPFINLATPDTYCFNPAAAELARLAALHATRTTPMSCGNRPGTHRTRRPKRRAGDRYTVASFRRAIERGCDDAFPPPGDLARRDGETLADWQARLTDNQRGELSAWRSDHRWHPHQLRHTRATAIRRQFGLEAAQHVLGHASLSVTEIYAEKNSEAARVVAMAIG